MLDDTGKKLASATKSWESIIKKISKKSNKLEIELPLLNDDWETMGDLVLGLKHIPPSSNDDDATSDEDGVSNNKNIPQG
jgi:hypothetical protein